MNFVSLAFLIFLPVVVLFSWLIPHKFRWVFLLIASYFFYAFTNFLLVFLILSTTLISYLFSLKLEKDRNKYILIFYLVIILGLLFVFKYLNFAIGTGISLMNLFGLELSPITLNIILPVGISFYTFQTLAYVVDIYKGKKEAEHHFGYFALFVSYFPQLVAGPIENSSVLLPQLKKEKKFSSDNFFKGIRFLTTGYIKKILIADLIGIYVAEVYGNILGYSGVSLLIATILFGFQIYGDFAGYSEIAIGCSSLLGIDLTTNFDRPYLSSSLKEFWNRWHITLNNFFTEYIYIPLGGSKKGKARQCLNIFIVFLISGIWHGASIHFVLWGIAHGILMIIENLLRPQLDKLWNDKFKSVRRILDTAIVFTLVSLVWVLFRANNFNDALTIYGRIFSFQTGKEIFFGGTTKVLMIVVSFVILICSYYLPTINLNLLKTDDRNIMNIVIYTSLIVVLIAVFAYELSTQGESSFIYFQF